MENLRYVVAWFVIILSVVSLNAHAQRLGPDLAKKYSCVACHRVDDEHGRKRLGPDFSVIAKRYAGNEASAKYLETQVRNGSRGSWGAIPMPAQSHVGQADVKALIKWVLSLDKVAQVLDNQGIEQAK